MVVTPSLTRPFPDSSQSLPPIQRPGLAEIVDLLGAGQDVGEAGVERALERLLLAERRLTRLLRRRGGDALGLGLAIGRRREDREAEQERCRSGATNADGARHQSAQ